MRYRTKLLKAISFFVLGFMVFMCMDVSEAAYAKGTARTENNEKKMILIDPGHGGIDGGAVSKKGTLEKDINLAISLKLRDELKKCGFNVIMSREEDVGLYSDRGRIRDKKREDLKNRCLLKENSGCHMFISIHQNAFPQVQYYGAQVWYSKTEDSKMLAHIVQENLKADLNGGNKRMEKPAVEGYKILQCRTIPSIIVECGFLSNAAEEEKLRTEDYQKKIAQSIAKSVVQFFEE